MSFSRPGENLWAVIMSGGSGTRFWPESRKKNPKQFLKIFGSQSLFEETLTRVRPLIPASKICVVTQDAYAGRTQKLSGLKRHQIIGEPVGRNTAPCTILAAALITKKDPQAVLAILPSDHRIGKPKLFVELLREASRTAFESGLPVTFGIQPSCAHTGYGYLERGGVFHKRGKSSVYRLKGFHEKPREEKAKLFFKSGRFFWNSGIFVWKAQALLEAAREHLPEAYEKAIRIASSASCDRALKQIYPAMPNVSIDYGLMEKMKGNILTIPADIDWCDLGGWAAFKEISEADASGNTLRGKVLTVGSEGNYAKAEGKLIALVGVKNLVVVETPDAFLVASRDQAESIRGIVSQLKDRGWKRYL